MATCTSISSSAFSIARKISRPRAADLQKLIGAAKPLYDSLDDGQKRRFAMLLHASFGHRHQPAVRELAAFGDGRSSACHARESGHPGAKGRRPAAAIGPPRPRGDRLEPKGVAASPSRRAQKARGKLVAISAVARNSRPDEEASPWRIGLRRPAFRSSPTSSIATCRRARLARPRIRLHRDDALGDAARRRARRNEVRRPHHHDGTRRRRSGA